MKNVYLENKDEDMARNALREIVEIYAGMDGFITETAPEAYQKRIIEQMNRIAVTALMQQGKPEKVCRGDL